MAHDNLGIWLYSIYRAGTEDITVAEINGFSAQARIHQAKWLAIRKNRPTFKLVPSEYI